MTAKHSVAAAVLALSLAFTFSACAASPSPAVDSSGSTTSRPTDSAKPLVTDAADLQEQADAVRVAVAAMTAFANHARSYDAWWADLSPYLDTAASEAYAYTDPRLVPPSQVTGPGVISAAISSTQVTVLVPTDTGQYRVELFRQADGAGPGPWLVNTMTPPGR